MVTVETLGIVVGNRGFFPDHLCDEGRRRMLDVLKQEGVEPVALSPEQTKFGTVETLADARQCADLFRSRRDDIQGVIVTLPNFGDERGVANALRWAELGVPVLIHAFADNVNDLTLKNRRDSFCGKMSVCNNLRQYGIKFTLTRSHTIDPESEEFRQDLRRFLATCRIVRRLKNARFGMIGARPAAFNTVRFSEKLLESAGISVDTLDLSEVLGRAARLGDNDGPVRQKLAAVQGYTNVGGIPQLPLLKMAKLGVVVDQWMTDGNLSASAIQCWTAIEEFYGVVPCTLMSMMSNGLVPSACETDIVGVLAMYIMQAASGSPSALLDWNNNYGGDPDRAIVFHCSNLPKDFFATHVMDHQEILAGFVGKENSYGTISGRVKAGVFTYCRVSTDDATGSIRAYTGQGEFTDDAASTFGGFGVVRVPRLQKLLTYICENGFEHHVAANMSAVGGAVQEALGKYMGWSVYNHDAAAV
jgi:L-fucose isomerase-like protein